MMAFRIKKAGLTDKKARKIQILKIISIIRHIHFMIFNVVVIDGSFFCLRVIAHIKVVQHSGIFVILISYLMILFFVDDLMNVFNTGTQLSDPNNPFHRDEITRMEKEFGEKIYKFPQ